VLEELPEQSVKHMKKADSEARDDLQVEYDLKSLRVRRLGPGRKSFCGSTVRLDPDVAEIFSSAESVNEALRFLIKIVHKDQLSMFSMEPDTLERTADSP
jgi:hypothetical protein